MSRKIFPFLVAVVTALAALVVPVSAGLIRDGADDAPARDSVGLRRVFAEITDGVHDAPRVDATVKLECAPRIGDERVAVHCAWRSESDLGVRAWQLWNIQIRPEHGERNLVVTLGADASAYTDTAVEAPAGYLYAVVGLDHDGEIVARSRVQSVHLKERDIRIEAIRLECAAHRVDAEPGVAIGCHWSEISNDAAVGYVLWKGVDGGARTVLARVGLDVTEVRDGAVAPGHRYSYVITAVDQEGHVVGRSRVAHVGIRPIDRPDDRPVDPPVDRPEHRPDAAPDHPVDRPAHRPADQRIEVDVVTDLAADGVTDRVPVRDSRGNQD